MRPFILFLVLACVAMPGTSPARTPDWVEGMYWNVHGRDTVQDLEPAAQEGNRNAQFQLGTGLLYGRYRFRIDENEGLRWLRRAAEQQYAAAALHLGAYLVYEKNSVDEGIGWLRRAVSAPRVASSTERPAQGRDEIIAARLLGVLLLAGPGAAEGVDLLQKASGQGDRIAQMLLGTAYIDGRGVPQDRAKGLELILNAQGKITLTALSIAALVEVEGIGAESDPKKAAKLLGAKSDSDAEAYYYVGRLYHSGFWYDRTERPLVDWFFRRVGTTEAALTEFYERQGHGGSYRWADLGRALPWYRRGAEAGHVGAQVNLGLIHFNRNSDHWDCAEGKRWSRVAAERGDPTAQLNLGAALRGGCRGGEVGVTKENLEESVAWFQKSADGGHLSGLFFLARAYREGKGVPQDLKKAMELYHKGAVRGDWQAAQEISRMYANGEGVPKSAELSAQWFKKAVQLRHASRGSGSEYFFQR